STPTLSRLTPEHITQSNSTSTSLLSRLTSQVPTPLRSRHRLVSSLQRKSRWIERILYLVLIPELPILPLPPRSSRMPQRLIAARSLKSQRVSSCISRRLRLESKRSLKMKVAGRLCLTLVVSHSQPPVDPVSDCCFEPELHREDGLSK